MPKNKQPRKVPSPPRTGAQKQVNAHMKKIGMSGRKGKKKGY